MTAHARRVEGELKDHPLLHGGHDEPDATAITRRWRRKRGNQRHYDWEDDAAPLP